MIPNNDDALLNVKTLAAMLGVHPVTLRRMDYSGKLPKPLRLAAHCWTPAARKNCRDGRIGNGRQTRYEARGNELTGKDRQITPWRRRGQAEDSKGNQK